MVSLILLEPTGNSSKFFLKILTPSLLHLKKKIFFEVKCHWNYLNF